MVDLDRWPRYQGQATPTHNEYIFIVILYTQVCDSELTNECI